MTNSTVCPQITYDSTVYTDKQFYADLKKSKKALDKLARRALKEHREGRTRRFPCNDSG